MKFGAHQSIAGGYDQSLRRITDIGGNCLQIFSTSPRSWNLPKIDENIVRKFIDLKKELGIEPIYFHASYLINLADEKKVGQLSKKMLISELLFASKLNIAGSIVHLGSFKDNPPDVWNVSKSKRYSILINNILEVLTHTPKDTLLIIENAGNHKIGQTLEEISHIVSDLDDERIKLCLDTCHLFSAGYSFNNEKELDLLLEKLEDLGLYEKIELFHANDSRDLFASFHDRHENIGQGSLGTTPFKLLLNHPKTKSYPFIIETPGFDKQGPDKKNLDILKSLSEGM